METAYVLVLEKPIAAIDSRMEGVWLAKMVADLDWTANEIGVRPLSEFLTGNSIIVRKPQVDGETCLTQFSALDGLKSIRALSRELRAWPTNIRRTKRVLAELAKCEQILLIATERGVRWHFELNS